MAQQAWVHCRLWNSFHTHNMTNQYKRVKTHRDECVLWYSDFRLLRHKVAWCHTNVVLIWLYDGYCGCVSTITIWPSTNLYRNKTLCFHTAMRTYCESTGSPFTPKPPCSTKHTSFRWLFSVWNIPWVHEELVTFFALLPQEVSTETN